MCGKNEPNINLELLDKVFIGTPHIAGYSADGKSKMLPEWYWNHFVVSSEKENEISIVPPEQPHVLYDSNEKRPPSYRCTIRTWTVKSCVHTRKHSNSCVANTIYDGNESKRSITCG